MEDKMKIMILDKIVKELRVKHQQSTLFGIAEKKTLIISSLEQKPGLKEIGTFIREKESLDKTPHENGLFFYMKDYELQCFKLLVDGTREEQEIEVVNYSTDFNARNQGILDESVLQNRTVTLVGLGSGGGAIALDLVRCGVTRFNFIEFDTISLSNLCRSVYDLPDIGKKKTDSILEKLLRINPCVDISLYDEDGLGLDY
jgi:hypothetical protein